MLIERVQTPAPAEAPGRCGGRVGREREDFEVFYAREAQRVLRALALTLRDGNLAADATQEAMARAWRRWDDVGRYDNPAGWVYRVGLNWARSRLRRLGRELLGVRRDTVVAAPEPPDPALADALRSLSVEHRAVLVLRIYLDWDLEQVADALHVPVGTVKSRQYWALRYLRERLGGPDPDPSTEAEEGQS